MCINLLLLQNYSQHNFSKSREKILRNYKGWLLRRIVEVDYVLHNLIILKTKRTFSEMSEFSEEELKIPPIKYEYLDHTADVQLHAWGDTLEEAFEQCALAMFGYMTEIEYVEMIETQEIEAEGHDMLSLLFHFLDEFLFLFCAEPFFIARKVKILEFDRTQFRIKAIGYGEEFQLGKHPQGTEVKAITYSNMQVHDNEGQHEVFVIIDI